ncbi:uncharacterized protein F4822DRAFT_442864 [Hypoxylon trugodes]|uniref:uncharacterized protein n=1 Tax=Hypoxylon trugodes TaxID=326681 RepID=UPI0021973723|nr:uncharacterized protein F4822DRAFT_442864 [Hypoxylon trugodes]KAI1389653.1 hypothetical protein F4822DRAFT_442864 [Hypoxylon trugodes]
MRSRWLLPLLAGANVLALPGKRYYLQSNDTIASNTTSSSPAGVYVNNGQTTSTTTTAPAVVLTASTVSTTSTSTATATYEYPSDKLGPVATLLPAIPHDHDGSDITHLTPKDSGSGSAMHYAQESTPGSAGIYAVAVPRWTAPSVVLDHSSLVVSVSVTASGDLLITFSDKYALEHASSTWTHETIVFVTYTENCGDYELGQRCYFSANIVIFDIETLTATATGQAKAIEELVTDVNLAWGSYGKQPVAYGTASASTASPSATGSGSDSPSSTYYSVSPSATTTCVPPVDTKYGLPTACLGPYFDDTLDEDLGYLEAGNFSYGALVEGILFDDEDEYQNQKRTILGSLSSGASKLANAAKEKIKSGAASAKNAAKSASKSLAKVATTVYSAGKAAYEVGRNIVTGQPNKFEKDFDKLILPKAAKECNDAKTADEKKKLENACKPKGGAKIVESPWGDAILIKTIGSLPSSTDLRPAGSKKQTTVTKGNFISFYCVKCGLTGSLKTNGNITIVVTKGITDGHFVADLNLNLGVGLGVHAEYYREDSFRNNLYDIPITPFTIGFASIGPVLSIGTELKFSVNMTGSALARADISLARAQYHYDWTKGGATSTGFTPQFKPTFEAEGQMELAVQFGVPVGLELAVTTFNGCEKCKGAVGFETIPSIKAAAAVAVQASYNATDKTWDSGLKPLNNCSGISTTLSVKNDLNAFYNGFGLVKGSKSLVNGTDHVIASYCIGNKTDGTNKGVIGLQSRLAISEEAYAKLAERDSVNSTSNGTQLYDLTEYVVENSTADLGFTGLELPDVPYNLDDSELEGYWYSTLSLNGSAGEYTLAVCDDGNLYVQKNGTQNSLPYYDTCNTLWSGFEDVVLTTPNSGVLHYYNNTMSKVGVSRLRAADEESIPATSVYVALAPFYYTDDESDDAPSMLAAIDPNNDIFFPVVCTYKNTTAGAKVYLVNEDVDAGLAMLKSPDIEYSITNGEVDECYVLFLEVTDRVDGGWAEYDDDAEEEYDESPIELEFDDSLVDDEGDLTLSSNNTLPYQDEEMVDDFDAVFEEDDEAEDWDQDSDYEDTFGDYYDVIDDDEDSS